MGIFCDLRKVFDQIVFAFTRSSIRHYLFHPIPPSRSHHLLLSRLLHFKTHQLPPGHAIVRTPTSSHPIWSPPPVLTLRFMENHLRLCLFPPPPACPQSGSAFRDPIVVEARTFYEQGQAIERKRSRVRGRSCSEGKERRQGKGWESRA